MMMILDEAQTGPGGSTQFHHEGTDIPADILTLSNTWEPVPLAATTSREIEKIAIPSFPTTRHLNDQCR